MKSFEKNPAKGGIPAIENKIKDKDKDKIGFIRAKENKSCK